MSYTANTQNQDWHASYIIDGRFVLESCILRTEDFVLWKGRDQKGQQSRVMITEHLPGQIILFISSMRMLSTQLKYLFAGPFGLLEEKRNEAQLAASVSSTHIAKVVTTLIIYPINSNYDAGSWIRRVLWTELFSYGRNQWSIALTNAFNRTCCR